MRVSTNVQSMSALRTLGQVNKNETKTTMKLSSGDRIYSASEDPAGLAISEGMNAKIRSLSQVKRNVNDGISLIQVAEGAISVLQDLGGRLKELSVAAASDTMGAPERNIINFEFQNLKGEIRRLVQSTKFNGQPLISGKAGSYDIQIGLHNRAGLDRMNYDIKEMLSSSNDFGMAGATLSNKGSAQKALGQVDQMVRELASSRAKLGSIHSRMEKTINNLDVSHLNHSASKSVIRDADVAKQTANQAKLTIAKNASMASLMMANSQPRVVEKLVG